MNYFSTNISLPAELKRDKFHLSVEEENPASFPFAVLDRLTAKHMYRFLGVAFERTDTVLIDTRAMEQLRRLEVVERWHIVSKADWQIAIRRHPNSVPERRMIEAAPAALDLESRRAYCRETLEKAGIASAVSAAIAEREPADPAVFDTLERAAHLLGRMDQQQVLPHVSRQIVQAALEQGALSEHCGETLDWIEIGILICEQKQKSGRPMRNRAGLIVKLAKDPEARPQRVSAATADTWRKVFRRREEALRRRHRESEERMRLLDYERYQEAEAERLCAALPEETRQQRRNQKQTQLRGQERAAKLDPERKAAENETMMRRDLIHRHVPSYEKWRLRRLVPREQDACETAGRRCA
jgi:hypothetical protein